MQEQEEKKTKEQQERAAREQKERDAAAKDASYKLAVEQHQLMQLANQEAARRLFSQYGDLSWDVRRPSHGGGSYSSGGSSYPYGDSSGGYRGGSSSSSDHRCLDGSRDMRYSDNWGFDKYS
jgi:hypothetical protein